MAATKTAAKKKSTPKPPPEPERGLEDLSIVQQDGNTAILTLGKEERLVDHSDLYRAAKKIAAALQETY